MGVPYDCHLFICTNRRPDGHPRGSCAEKGSEEVRARFKSELDKRGLRGSARANAAGCLDTCERGISVVVYPNTTWYQHVTVEDVAEIVEQHVIGGKPVERLLMPLEKKAVLPTK
jgi:(2Fe-2S) ferredoxin